MRSKIDFLKRKKTYGTITESQLIDSGGTNEKITFTNRLSPFNMKAFRILSKLKFNSSIESFHLHNGLMRYKNTSQGAWNRIKTDEELKSLQNNLQDVEMTEINRNTQQ